MPINEGECLTDYELRLEAEWKARQPAAKPVTEMNTAERKIALAALERAAAPRPRQLPADLIGLRVEIMTLDQRRRAARALGFNY